ncbi:hypothetical protein K431DRAFT_344803 [Polychaeton citri CBS 116435]|uniref:Histidine kinase n=1 Tax=Polychaeton citri CBS 116435 TaxID=1314669 RepID=A0A9P4QEI2_9PEZI|nr:hypothetical protein K431DRAFT_344803 [Polychaeton citri CBS 116435]
MTNVDVDALDARQRTAFEEHRAKDFYRYYTALKFLTGQEPAWTDLFDPIAAAAHRPVTSPDRTLTALCQLANTRLEGQRAMLFFFDSTQGYVLAEAARKANSDCAEQSENNLWLGHTVIPRGLSVCEHTVNIPLGNKGSNRLDSTAGAVHIIKDLTESVFCNRPYVSSGPKARFYAGVPIRTPRGNNIGALCVLDDKSRSVFTQEDIDFLVDLSITVMGHLELLRRGHEQQRGTDMIRGLTSFMTHSGVKKTGQDIRSRKTGQSPTTAGPPTPSYRDDRYRRLAPAVDSSKTSYSDHIGAFGGPVSTPSLRTNVPGDGNDNALPVPTTEGTSTSSLKDINSRPPDTNEEIHQVFHLAAQLIQDCVSVDGVAFLSLQSFEKYEGGTEGSPFNDEKGQPPGFDTNPANDDNIESLSLPNNNASSPQQTPRQHRLNESSILGLALPASHSSSQTIPAILKDDLHQLLERYPKGATWSLTGDQGEKIFALDSQSTSGCAHKNHDQFDFMHTGRPGDFRQPSTARQLDERDFPKLFPDAKSVSLIGLWDQSLGQWYAAAFVWTISPMRIFSWESEFHYLTALCDVIMAEVNKIQARAESNAKSGFVSSISHEMRTPLHGILGTIELLQDMVMERPITTMIGQVQACSQTLLDIIDHLLEFNNLSRSSSLNTIEHADAQVGIGRHNSTATSNAKKAPIFGEGAGETLVRITEEVVSTVVYSFHLYKQRIGIPNESQAVSVIFDVDEFVRPGCKVSMPGGAWKRMCMNIVNNALKYTASGYIHISLECVSPSGISQAPAGRELVLSVRDSGCGMSEDFRQHHLFRAFAKEDHMVEGLGLGLNLAGKIAESLGGNIKVQSRKGFGTLVRVAIPVTVNSRDIVPANCEPLTHVSIGLPDPTSESSSDALAVGRELLLNSIHNTCRSHGAKIVMLDHPGVATGVNIILDTYILQYASPTSTTYRRIVAILEADPVKPLVIICSSPASQQLLMRFPWVRNYIGPINYAMQPCGPQRLVQTVLDCLEDKKAVSVNLTKGLQAKADQHLSRKPEPSIHDEVEPIAPVLAASSAIEPSSLGNASSTVTASLQMIIVDDNPLNVRILEVYARKKGYKVVCCENGHDAVQAYKRLIEEISPTKVPDEGGGPPIQTDKPTPPLILMDINMPVMDGYEATRQIRALEQQHFNRTADEWSNTIAKIVAVTALGSAEAEQEGYRSGMDVFLTKPIKLKSLTQVIASLYE